MHWHKLPREVAEHHPGETRLDGTLSKLVQRKVSLAMARVLELYL